MLRVYTPCNFPAYLLALSSGILMLYGREIRQLPSSGGLFPLHMLYSREKSVGKSGAAAGVLFMVSDESHRFDHGVNHNTIKRISSATGCPILLEDVQRSLILRELCMSRYDKNATYVNSKV